LIDDLKLASAKTKEFAGVLKALQVKGTALVVAPSLDEQLVRASRNVPDVEVTTSEALNPYQVLRSDKLIFIRGAFEKVEARLQQD